MMRRITTIAGAGAIGVVLGLQLATHARGVVATHAERAVARLREAQSRPRTLSFSSSGRSLREATRAPIRTVEEAIALHRVVQTTIMAHPRLKDSNIVFEIDEDVAGAIRRYAAESAALN